MLKRFSVLLLAAAAFVAVSQFSAQAFAQGASKFTPGLDQIDGQFRRLNLTAEQKAKLAALKKEYAPKFLELAAKMEASLTDEQKKARNDAMAAALASGKKGFQAYRAGEAAVKLTADQKKVREEVHREMRGLIEEVRGKAIEMLSPEQKEKLEKLTAAHKKGTK